MGKESTGSYQSDTRDDAATMEGCALVDFSKYSDQDLLEAEKDYTKSGVSHEILCQDEGFRALRREITKRRIERFLLSQEVFAGPTDDEVRRFNERIGPSYVKSTGNSRKISY